MGINVLSLFDGISCGMLALDKCGIEVDKYYSSEIDKNAITISKHHYQNIIQMGDITELLDNKLKTLSKIDLVIGGSPCTNLSRAGNGKGLKGNQSKLFFEYMRVLRWIQRYNNPNVYFLLENVEMKKQWEDIITKNMLVKPIAINSKLLSAQNRPRIYWTNIPNVTIPEDKNILLKDILIEEDIKFIKHNGLLMDARYNEFELKLVNVINEEVRVSQATKLGYIVADDGDGVNLSFPKSKTRRGRVIRQKTNTLDCQCNISVYHNGMIRKLNIIELERLQTLPEGYTNVEGMGESIRKKAIGNGWTVDVIVHIFKNLGGVFK